MSSIKNTLKLGGSQAVSIIISLIRNKAIALLIGPSGIALLSIYQSVISFGKTFFSMGISQAIPKFISDNDTEPEKHHKLIFSTYISIILTGIFMVSCWIFLHRKATTFFNIDTKDTPNLILAIFFTVITELNISLLQSFKKFALIARYYIVVAFLSLTTIPFYYVFGEEVILYMLLLLAIINLLVSFHFLSFKFLQKIYYYSHELNNISRALMLSVPVIKLGIFLILSTAFAEGTLLLIKSFIQSEKGDLELANFQASWFIATFCINILLNSMLTFFYPELASNQCFKTQNLKVNSQLRLTLKFGLSIIIGLIIFSEEALYLLYSSEFVTADLILERMLIATGINLIIWPIGVILLANGKGVIMLILNVIHQSSLLIFFHLFKQFEIENQIGYSYILSSLIFLILNYFTARKINEFRFDLKNITFIFIYSVFIIGTITINKSQLLHFTVLKYTILVTCIAIVLREIILEIKKDRKPLI